MTGLLCTVCGARVYSSIKFTPKSINRAVFSENYITSSLFTVICLGTFGSSLFNFLNYYVWPRITDEVSVPEIHIWSILIIRTDLTWCLHLSRSLFIFQLLGECHGWWTNKFPKAHVTKFYSRLRLIRSVFRASKFAALNLIEIVILWVYYTIPFCISLFRRILCVTFQLFKLVIWPRITDEGSVPEMCIWSILLIKSDLKWCIHFSRSLFILHFCFRVSVAN